MKKYIIVNNQGVVVSVQQPTYENQLTEGWNGEVYVKEISPEMDTSEVLADFYWNFEDSALVAYPSPRPGPFWYWESGEWVKYPNEYLDALKKQRNLKLSASDWTQIPDSPLTTEQRAAWATYRQALRDLPANLTGEEVTVEDAPWPTPPTI